MTYPRSLTHVHFISVESPGFTFIKKVSFNDSHKPDPPPQPCLTFQLNINYPSFLEDQRPWDLDRSAESRALLSLLHYLLDSCPCRPARLSSLLPSAGGCNRGKAALHFQPPIRSWLPPVLCLLVSSQPIPYCPVCQPRGAEGHILQLWE